MTYRFVARSAGADTDLDHDCVIEAGISEGEAGSGFLTEVLSLSGFHRDSLTNRPQQYAAPPVEDRMTDVHELSSPDALPDPQETLTQTNWAELNHAYGPAEDVPKMLVALLDANQAVRTKALDDLHHVVHHQNTLYEATTPTALYVAAILSDPRTTGSIDKDRWSFPGNMRAELLGWINSVANEVTDVADTIGSEHGFPLDDYPPAVAVRDIRPQLFSAAFAYTDDSDRHVREAAIAACIPLLDDPQVRHHRTTLVPLIRQILGTSELWQYRERAIDALDAWGKDSSGLEGQRDPFEFCNTDLVADHRTRYPGSDAGCSGEPPF